MLKVLIAPRNGPSSSEKAVPKILFKGSKGGNRSGVKAIVLSLKITTEAGYNSSRQGHSNGSVTPIKLGIHSGKGRALGTSQRGSSSRPHSQKVQGHVTC